MKVALSKSYTQLKRGRDHSRLVINVEYDTVNRELELKKLWVCDLGSKTCVDISVIMFNNFHDQTEAMINSIDWWEVYRESKEYAGE